MRVITAISLVLLMLACARTKEGASNAQAGNFASEAQEGFEDLQDNLDDMAAEETDPSKREALGDASGALDKLIDAFGGLDGLRSSQLARAKAAALAAAFKSTCNAGLALSNAGYEQLAIAFFELCNKQLIWEVHIDRDGFTRDTQTDSLAEVAHLLSKWNYESADPVYMVYKTEKPYSGEPPELAELHYPRQILPLYRCWEKNANYYFNTTSASCDGVAQDPNPPDPMGVRRKLGYISARQTKWAPATLQRFRNLGIPNDVAAAAEERINELSQNYESVGVLGYVPY